MQIVIDISKDRYDEIMSMDWKNCRLIFDEELRAIHDGKTLEQEPSSSENPKIGRWKRISRDLYVQHAMAYYECSECGKKMIGTHNYCPNCGCKMKEAKE